MDLNHILFWTIGASCILAIVQAGGQRPGWNRQAAPAIVLITLGLGKWLRPDIAGYVAAALWCYLMLVPAVGNALVSLLLMRKWYSAARWTAWMVAGLQPFSENFRLPILIQAMALLQRGKSDAAMPLLQRLMKHNGQLGRTAMVLQIRQSGDWQRLLDWLASRPEQASLMAEPMLLDGYLQALGETGNTLLMLREFDRISRQLASNLHTTPLSMIRAKVAAFCGDEETVSELLSRPLKSLSQEMCRYWLATALQAQGRIEEAESIFRTLAAIPDSPLARPAFNRIATPVSRFCPQQASSFDIEILSQLKTGLQTERRHRPAGAPSRRRTWVTWILAASLATVFLFEIPGGSEDIANLAELGALVVPVSITPGEHWRIFTAAFLHFGPIHLLLNVLALLFLGSWLERLWGPWLTLVSYLLSAFGSIGLAPFFMNDATFWNPAILLGASGGVMGLIGGLIVQTAFNWWNVRSALMAREFQLLATVIVLQVIFDQNSPNISSQAHLLGLAIGSLCGVAWNLFRLALHRPHAEA